jgi:hypothetical protein
LNFIEINLVRPDTVDALKATIPARISTKKAKTAAVAPTIAPLPNLP